MHNRTLRAVALAAGTALTLLSATVYAEGADPANGKKLYESKCFTCHDPSIHTRQDKIIFSKKALANRVKMCEANANAHWNEKQINDVIEYINNTYYKYD